MNIGSAVSDEFDDKLIGTDRRTDGGSGPTPRPASAVRDAGKKRFENYGIGLIIYSHIF